MQAILNSLDACWAKIDHDLFLVAIALNPFVKTKVFAPAISPMLLVTMIEWLYCCVFEVPSPLENLGSWAITYLTSDYDVFGYPGGDWNETNLCTCVKVCITQFPMIPQAGSLRQNLNPLEAWRCVPSYDPLRKLALLIFSFICNSADSEQFSLPLATQRNPLGTGFQ